MHQLIARLVVQLPVDLSVLRKILTPSVNVRWKALVCACESGMLYKLICVFQERKNQYKESVHSPSL